ncbi:hypothetical protein [Aneurinibacillus migulanus]|uniref:hypothetical protein n=1 Tax=Aneurinibacillus migulanus TaxID=47500 RepID=UPI00209FDB45|nr:hypothetical protein [Aneurinibacillus migulanus]MCP1355099.1 hypothetical protein [Aneurinibacillus migulanus]
MKYEIIDGVIYQIEEIKTDNQTSIVKTLATNIKYDDETGEFIPVPPPEPIPPQPNPIEQLQQDQNAVMLGLLDLYNQQQQSEDKRVRDSDAVMMGMMDLYKQVQELKAKIEGGA